jgi:hypothetical protein
VVAAATGVLTVIAASYLLSQTTGVPQVRFHDAVRKLREDHVTWTRLAIVTFADGPDATMREAMKVHLDQTLAEAVDELRGNYTASVTDYEAIHLHILAIADLLRSGIMRQFPGRFG